MTQERDRDVLVLGVGNLLLEDEGAGVRALGFFQERYETPAGAELLDGGTSGLALLQHLGGRDALIVLDVVQCGKEAGGVVRLAGGDVPAFFRRKISPHQLGVADLLAAAELVGVLPAEVVLLGIQPKSVGTGLEMSGEVVAGMEVLVDLLAEELGRLGLAVERRRRDNPPILRVAG